MRTSTFSSAAAVPVSRKTITDEVAAPHVRDDVTPMPELRTTAPSPRKRVKRCGWAGDEPLMVAYHDEEWGVPSHDDRHLFEMLVLEGAQAGLSWATILRKREGYREAFEGFDVDRVARMTPARVERLLKNPAIVRNRAKVESTVINARALRASPRRVRFARPLSLVVHRWPPDRQPVGRLPAGASDEPRVRRDEQGAEGARLQVRRLDHLLRLYAGHRHGR